MAVPCAGGGGFLMTTVSARVFRLPWRLAVALGTVLLASCATVPSSLVGTYSPVQPQQVHGTSAVGTSVRWGGTILRTSPGPANTCFNVLGRPLASSDARPQRRAATTGRFAACARGFYDPAVYARGREITVVGVVRGVVWYKVGGYTYAEPRVAASAVHLWPRPVVYRYDRFDGWNTPFWGPGWGYMGPWGGGWGYDPMWGMPGPTVIVGGDDDDDGGP